jgi:imidazolonepropionase
VIQNARVLSLGEGGGVRRGDAMADLGVIERGDVVVEHGRVASVIDRGAHGEAPTTPDDTVIDANGRVLMPAFVDAHTHACWAGDRLDEWERKQAGESYLDILKQGGGIMSTVRASREASEERLASLLVQRLGAMLDWGSTTIEVKTGYGLDTDAELKMLRAIDRAAAAFPGRIVPTALIAHAIDPEFSGGRDAFVDMIISETLPAVAEHTPGVTIDAYCEDGAWTFDEAVKLFETAMELGCAFRVHTDQFNELGMTRWAIEHGVRSVDHLEASSQRELTHVAQSGTPAVLLPCSGFHVDQRFADGRLLIDNDGAVVIASNYNPGSAPCASMAMTISLAVRHNGMTAAEAICASTRNAAALLGLDDVGRIEPGVRADLVLLRHTDERALGYEFGGDPVEVVLCDGRLVIPRGVAVSAR